MEKSTANVSFYCRYSKANRDGLAPIELSLIINKKRCYIQLPRKEKPLVVEAYMKLGPEKVRQMKYHVYNIKQELVKLSHETQDVKIFLLIDPKLEKGVAIPRSEIKELLEKAYRTLGINYKAKATELKRWYNLRETTKRGSDGKPIACFVIVSTKITVGR